MNDTTRVKWPLRLQIMTPMTLLMLVTVLGLSVFHVYQAARQQRAMTEQQIRGIAQTLQDSRFPLTDSVLDQMKGLTGAEFVLVSAEGQTRAATQRNWLPHALPDVSGTASVQDLKLSEPLQLAEGPFLHAALRMRPRDGAARGDSLHILYPQHLFERQRREAILPALAIGSIALLLVAAAASIIASRVSKPLSRLGWQVARIAEGDFQPMPLPATHDEVRKLSMAVNEMANMLNSYEATIRRTEQVRTLGQLGGALAHQLRNSATGARMALDIHRGECPNGQQSESLDVGLRQLVFMERYIQRFLSLGTRQSRSPTRLNLVELVGGLLPLLEPASKHVGVRLDADLPSHAVWVRGEHDALEQLVLNLLLNAIEATSATAAARASRVPCVRTLMQVEGHRVALTIEDNGPGPPSEIAGTLFESFVTSKPDGVGLGLAIAQQVAAEHGGTISWTRADHATRFRVELPLASDHDENQQTTDAPTFRERGQRVEAARS